MGDRFLEELPEEFTRHIMQNYAVSRYKQDACEVVLRGFRGQIQKDMEEQRLIIVGDGRTLRVTVFDALYDIEDGDDDEDDEDDEDDDVVIFDNRPSAVYSVQAIFIGDYASLLRLSEYDYVIVTGGGMIKFTALAAIVYFYCISRKDIYAVDIDGRIYITADLFFRRRVPVMTVEAPQPIYDEIMGDVMKAYKVCEYRRIHGGKRPAIEPYVHIEDLPIRYITAQQYRRTHPGV